MAARPEQTIRDFGEADPLRMDIQGGAIEAVLAKNRNLASVFARWEECEENSCSNETDFKRDKSPFSKEIIMCNGLHMLRGTSRQLHKAQRTKRLGVVVKDMNSCKSKSEIMSFHGSHILIKQTHPAWCESRTEAHEPYLGETFDGGTKAIDYPRAVLYSGVTRERVDED
uniref:Uncharacterized protein n=1 Tax=Musa balbisiana TaxID=52838 RepID=Q1EP62_MUSBA|nr:hypothetical protein MBP_81C12.28 [Musa balbisiana]